MHFLSKARIALASLILMGSALVAGTALAASGSGHGSGVLVPKFPDAASRVFATPRFTTNYWVDSYPWLIAIGVVTVVFLLGMTLLALWAARRNKRKALVVIVSGASMGFVALVLLFLVTGNFFNINAPALPLTGAVGNLTIPSINVSADIVTVGLTDKGAMDTPPLHPDVGWFMLGPKPGDRGTAVIDGHSGFWLDGQAAVFDSLYRVKVGERMKIVDENGKPLVFEVKRTKVFAATDDATEVFTSTDDGSHLNLITCYGPWDDVKKEYSQRLVVFTDLIEKADIGTPVTLANAPGLPQATTAYVYKRALTVGSTGDDVKELQNFLIGAGFLQGVSSPSGRFDAPTKAALILWQKANAIAPATGRFGPKSMQIMNAYLLKKAQTPPI